MKKNMSDKYYKYQKKTPETKWKIVEGSTPDDIIFSDGQRQINFDLWLQEYYN